MNIMIEQAKNVKVDDIIIVAVHNENYERGIDTIGRVLEINIPHEEIVEFKLKVFAEAPLDHVSKSIPIVEPGENEFDLPKKIGMRFWRAVGIIRK